MLEHSTQRNDTVNALAALLDDFLLHNKVDVPVLPAVASKVMTMSQSSDTDAKKLAQLIQGDQAMAAHVMKVANSPVYSSGGSLVSLQQAIARLGFAMISDIAVSVSVGAKLFDVPDFKTEIASMWQHALATALWSKEIARVCRNNVEAVFLCGLLHSIGHPSSLQKIIELKESSEQKVSRDQCMDLVQNYQQEFGLQIVEEWKMPTLVCDVLKYFYDFKNSGDAIETTATVVTGSYFARFMLWPGQVSEDDLRELETLEAINLYPDQIDELIEKYDSVQMSMETMSV